MGRRASADGVDKGLSRDVDLLGYRGAADSLSDGRGSLASAVATARGGADRCGRGGSLRGGAGRGSGLLADGGGQRDGAGDQDGRRRRAVGDGLGAASRGEDLSGVDDRGDELRDTSRVADVSHGEREAAAREAGRSSAGGHRSAAGSGERRNARGGLSSGGG